MPPPTTFDALPDHVLMMIAEQCASACHDGDQADDPAVLARLACACRATRALLLDPASDALWVSALRGTAASTAASSRHADLVVPLDSWWRLGQSIRASYLALLLHRRRRLLLAQAPAPAPAPSPPFSSPQAAALTASWASKAVERVIDAHAAFEGAKRAWLEVEGRGGGGASLAGFAGSLVSLIKASDAAAEASVVATAVAERARCGAEDATAAAGALPPVSEDVGRAAKALGQDLCAVRKSSSEQVQNAMCALLDTLHHHHGRAAASAASAALSLSRLRPREEEEEEEDGDPSAPGGQ